jgi:hypothetical protein
MNLVEPGSSQDTPINRATVNQISVDELDQFLDGIRERRLSRVKKLEAAAKVKADDAQLTVYLKFEKAHAKALKMLTKMKEDEDNAEAAVNKVRALVMEMGG